MCLIARCALACAALLAIILPSEARVYDARQMDHPTKFTERPRDHQQHSRHFHGQHLRRPHQVREVTDNRDGTENLPIDTFDYVICGGGTAGLTVAHRLTEDRDVTVAVIEAGDHTPNTTNFDVPAAAFYRSSFGGPADWQYMTTNQSGLLNQAKNFPRGKTTGGSSAINGMYLVRATARQHNSWAVLNNATDVWGWPNYFKYAKKFERFVPPQNNIKDQILYNPASHGTTGQVYQSWSGEEYDVVTGYLRAWQDSGVPMNGDPYGGDNTGAFLATSDINPTNWTRCYARPAWLDPIVERPNFHLIANAHCTRVVFSDGPDANTKKATSVQFGSSADKIHEIKVNQEVIVAGGVVGSPQILQLSGVGDPLHLRKVGIEPVIELEGVGWHLADHISSRVFFAPKQQTILPAAKITGEPRADSVVNAATCFVNTTRLMGDQDAAKRWIKKVKAHVDDIVDELAQAGAPSTVLTGYRVILNEQIALLDKLSPSMEFLLATVFSTMQIQVALQSQLSRGSVLINSADPFVQPDIDPGYLRSKYDVEMLVAGNKLARQLAQQPAFAAFHDGEKSDTSVLETDEDWEAWLRKSATTEFHPTGSCSMLPKEWGGTVDNTLTVHGTTNVRVIDNSIVPSPPSCHLMSVAYGVAEIGSDLIKAKRQGVEYKGTSAPGDPNSPDRYKYFHGVGGGASLTGDADVSDPQQPSPSGAKETSGGITFGMVLVSAAAVACIVGLV